MDNLNDQEQIRRLKINELEEKGVKPFGESFKRDENSKSIYDKYASFSKEELEEKHIKATVAGRIILKRGKGKVTFLDIIDISGKLQIYIRADNVTELDYEVCKKSDIGDIIGIEGYVIRTDMGELTIKAIKYTHLTKALRPLPEKYHGLQDVEEARRKRYLDLIVNEESKNIALLRPKIIRAIQHFFDNRGFIEVETPILHPILGGANAKPFITHHNALDMNFYLRIATELPLKKLIVGGLEAVYEIGRLFRNEGMDSTHNPEFTTVEAYLAYSDMYGMMDLVEDFFKEVVYRIKNTLIIDYQNTELDFNNKFKRIHMVDAVKQTTKIDFFKITKLDDALKLAKEHNIKYQEHEKTIGHIINLFFEHYVEDTLIQPTLIYGHPIEISPLAKIDENDKRFTHRFELFINKKEYANAFSELNDPIDQKNRFTKQLEEKTKGNLEANEMDYDYIEALEYGLPPTGGIGIGIDRFIMLLTNSSSIRDILLFPHMKQK